MGHILFWLEAAAASVLLVALGLALLARARGRARRWALRSAIVVLGVLPWVGAIALFAFVQATTGGAASPLVGASAAGALFAAAAVMVIRRGLRRSLDAPDRPAAAQWRTSRLLPAWAAGVVLACMTFWNLDLAVRQDMAALRTEAGALALSALPPRVPDSQNAAVLYRQAWEILDARDDAGGTWKNLVVDWLRPSQGRFDPNNGQMLAFLDKQAPVIDMLRQAGRLPGCDFGGRYNPPSPDLLLPELSRMRELGRLLCLSARVNAHHGRPAGALEDISACFALADHGASHPALIGVLVACALEEQAFIALEDVLARATPTGEDLEHLRLNPFQSFNDALHRSMRMEAAFGLTFFTMPDPTAAGVSKKSGFPGIPAWYRVFLWSGDVTAYRQWMRRYEQLSALPYHESQQEWRRLAEEVHHGRLGGVLTSMVLPALSHLSDHTAKADAQHRLAVLAAAMWRYRLRQGAFPDKLESLVPAYLPAAPADPFTGKSMKLGRTGDGKAVIYSIGEDLEDNGGQPFGKESRKGDIPLVLGR